MELNYKLETKNIEGFEVRTAIVDGERWYCGSDIGVLLGAPKLQSGKPNVSLFIAGIDEKHKTKFRIANQKGNAMVFIDDDALETLVQKARRSPLLRPETK